MPRDVSGNYTLPAGNPVVPNTIIASNWANTTMQDIADALTASLSIDGSVTTAKIADDAVTRAKLNGLDANGMVAAISATEFEARTITGTANKITVTNGDGVAGDPTLTIPDAVTFVNPTVQGESVFNGNMHIRTTGGAAIGIDLGNIDNQASSPYIDFHSGTDGTNDYDTRIIATGGTAANGAGNLNVECATFNVNGSEVYRRNNILGSVAQSGGVPTAAIIERGSNGNGEYVRFADGTQICNFVLSQSDINIASGTVFTSNAILWTYPAAFAAPPCISPRVRDFGDTWAGSGGAATSTTQCVVQAFRGATFTGGPYAVEIQAVGRWF